MSLALQLPSSLTVGLLAPYKSYLRWPRLDDLVLFVLFDFTLVAEPRSSASGLDRSTQQSELRSSAMSGGTDRREDEHVPQVYGRIDENFAEWETDVRLGQVEFKLEDRDRFGPRLYRKLGTQDVPQFTVGQHHSMPQRQRVWRTS